MPSSTTACTTADSAKPRIRAHRISQNIEPVIAGASPIATHIAGSVSGNR
ncbi:hypothetical protein RAM_33720 [Amycolatopsis mediterranei S699]|uniref:Uncharacterized protein n=1 Tax=Amycolatopsis mediterranei (strain S699) TaxID=713604 RepID=A0A9R0P2Z1_AMYMS|nr:hypothetical protein RAM_33720 [Amycolatopsis mediterranei S699]